MRTNRGIFIHLGLFAVLIATALALPDSSDGHGHGHGHGHEEQSAPEHVTVTAVGRSGAVLAALAVAALQARGVAARVQSAPLVCEPPESAAPSSTACRRAVLAALAGGSLHAVLVPAPAADVGDAFALRDLGIEDVGDAAPLARRGCFVTPTARDSAPTARDSAPTARSLLDLADPLLAARYTLADRDIVAAAAAPAHSWLTQNDTCTNCTLNMGSYPEWCSGRACATLLTSDEADASVLEAVVSEHRLLARVARLGARLATVAAALAPLVLCERTPALTLPDPLRAAPLGPPPCLDAAHACPFEPRRLVKLVNAAALAQLAPRALHVLARLTLTVPRLRELREWARDTDAAEATRLFLAAHPGWPGGPAPEVRVGVLLPLSGPREAYDAPALAAAAELAEEDAAAEGSTGARVTFKVELVDDGCAATSAFKYLTDSLGSEYHALAGVVGPACGAAFADVARQSPTHRLPVVAYTGQAAPAAGRYAVLAAGSARLGPAAAAAVLAALGWRRVAVLSELATRATLDVAQLVADVVVHVELPDDSTQPPLYDLVSGWAERVSSVNGRVLYVSVEDARVVRAALCAGRRAGLAPAAGAVWVLPPGLPPGWLEPRPGDVHPCTRDQLAEVAVGHLSVAPSWLADWEDEPGGEGERVAWEARWRARCMRGSVACGRPPPHAALLYDALRLLAAALARMLAAQPAALDDLHDEAFVRNLIENATSVPFTGLTGPFTWTSDGCNGGRARSTTIAVRQWQPPGVAGGSGGSLRRVGRWSPAGGLELDTTLLRWQTGDGAAPDDGGEQCGLQRLAELLRTDCRTAFIALAALVLALVVAALAAAALHCKRRAERQYRARLAALGLRSLAPKPGGLDKWEVARERVVINRKLGTGAFGTVYGGHALLAEERGWSAVAVKTLKAGASTEEKLDFLSEAEAMKRFDHKNVVRLLGVVTRTEPVCTVMEFMLYGDLRTYLLARRHLAVGGDEEVSAARLTSMALDAARALSYLGHMRYVHRDVAARNCLVSAHRVVKLADFGMSRLVFDTDYYRFSRKGLLPVRWMAPESLALGVFSPASDVWSFGVLLYEIVTFGSLPFQGFSNSEVLARVKAGHTPDLPAGLKPQLEGLIKSCWRQEHKARPGAAEVAAFLADWPRLLTPCLDVPLDALPLDADLDSEPASASPWRVPRDRAEARWVSWAAPASATTDMTDVTDTTYLSAEPPPEDTDAFLP